MDIYCPKCGEPTDMDELHEVPGATFEQAAQDFRQKGCAVFDEKCSGSASRARAELARTAMALSDHPDDWATDLADLEEMGFF